MQLVLRERVKRYRYRALTTGPGAGVCPRVPGMPWACQLFLAWPGPAVETGHSKRGECPRGINLSWHSTVNELAAGRPGGEKSDSNNMYGNS